MSRKEIMTRIEEIVVKAEMAHSLRNALFAAIYRQEYIASSDFEWAFVLLGNLTSSVIKELKELVQVAENESG